MTSPAEGDAAMSFDTQSAVNGQGIKDLTIKASFPDATQTLQENNAAHMQNESSGMNGSHAPADAKTQVADFNLPTPTDSVVDSSAPNGASALSAMDTDPPASSEAAAAPAVPEDPAVQQPVSESRDPVEPVSQAQAAEIQAVKESTDAAAESTTSAPEPTVEPVAAQPQEIIPVKAEPSAPAAAVDAMDTTEAPVSQQIPAADPLDSAVATANGVAPEKPVDPAPTPAPSAPAQIKTEVAAAGAPLALLNTDTEMKDAPPSPGKMSRGREDDSGLEEPDRKRQRADEKLTLETQSPATAGSPASPAPGPAGDKDFNAPISEPQQKAISTVIANTKRSTHANSFSRPVDPVLLNIPTYPDIIKEPMDLGTMNEKVKNRKYDNVQAFVYDFNLIISNCERFNGTGHTVTGLAHKLRETFEKQMIRVPSADFVEPPPPEKKKKIAAPRAPARRESRVPATPKTPVAASPTTFSLNPDGMPLIRRDSSAVDGRPRREIHPPASKDLPYNARPKKKKYQVELRFCSAVLHELDKAKYQQWAAPFKMPVDPVALNIPTYHKVIKKPMDLSTMRKRLDSGYYENAKDFDTDMRLIFNNCYKFNKPEDWVYQAGKRLEQEYDLEWAKKDDYIRANAPDNNSAGSSPEAESDEDDDEDDDDDDVPDDKIAAIQSQMEAMSQQLAALQKSKGKKKTPPALKKKGSKIKKEKVEKPAKKSGKKKGGAVPYVSYEQKQDISNRINTLPEQRMMQALDIIKNNMPQLKGANDDELELDIDELSNEVLYKLLQFVKKYAPRAEDETIQRRQSYAPSQPAKPKKNKPMGAKEQDQRIQELKRMQAGDVDGVVEESSDDDDEESEDESEED